MSDNVYKVVEIVGSSSKSSDDAVEKAIAEASKGLRLFGKFIFQVIV